MNQKFDLKFDDLKSNQANEKQNSIIENDLYDSPGHVRNLCFVWPDGRMMFMNYAYLNYSELEPKNDLIKIHFTFNVVTLKGFRLQILFKLLQSGTIREIRLNNERYNNIDFNIAFTINEIEVVSKF